MIDVINRWNLSKSIM